jgi:beta-glucanase (GH16 family)
MRDHAWIVVALIAALPQTACGLGADPAAGDAAPSIDAAGDDDDDGDGGPVLADASIASEVSVAFKTKVTGQYLSATDGGGGLITADRASAQGWEIFSLVDLDGGSLDSGDAVALRASNGRLFSVVANGTLNAAALDINAASTFRLVRRDGDGAVAQNDAIGLEHPGTGTWITAVNGGGSGTNATGAELGDFQTFQLEYRDLLPPPPPTTEWKLVWQDEFDGPDIDESKWSYEVKNPGWVNHELQAYVGHRSENARIENGALVLEGRRDFFDGDEYTSARLHTHGKASWQYGRVEARLQVPNGKGTWPAFWMMPDNSSPGWPECGEIDVMEHVGYDSDRVHATTHSLKYNWKAAEQRTGSVLVPGATTGFHTVALEWRPDRIDAYADGKRYFTSLNDGTGNDAWPFDKSFYLILNLAIGGDWGGAQGVDPNVWPQRYVIDYVRVYEAVE